MEKMLNDYLQFAKNKVQESTTSLNLNQLFHQIKNNFNEEKLTISCENDISCKWKTSCS